MAGHSKWANTKHRKARVDAKRGKVFTKILKEVTVAARLGGGDPSGNPRLRQVIQEARSNNVPNDTVERAIKKGTGELEGVNYEEIAYEGYGPGGVAILIEAMTDNRNRTVGEIRNLFSKHGGNMGENGCVAWMFDRRGFFLIGPEGFDEEGFMELAVELGAEDFKADEDGYQLYTSPEDYISVLEALEGRDDIDVQVKQFAMIPQNQVHLEERDAGKMIRLMEMLEDHDDVQHVWSNFDIDEEVLERITA